MSFIAVSDFHSTNYPMDKIVNYYSKEYDNIYILGDSTDRGPLGDGSYGVDMLLQIMRLSKESEYSDTANIYYIPGNHDKFLYDYAFLCDEKAFENLLLNHGSRTIEDINSLKQNNPDLFLELMDWLGSRPLQIVMEDNNKKYAMAHAFFDNELYNYDKNLCLESFYTEKNDLIKNELLNILWFRKSSDDYISRKVPTSDYTIVIGHTVSEAGDTKHNLINAQGEEVKVVCVDGGMTFRDGNMLKYTGGDYSNITRPFFHNTPNNNIEKEKKDTEEEINSKNEFEITKIKRHRYNALDIIKLYASDVKEIFGEFCESTKNALYESCKLLELLFIKDKIIEKMKTVNLNKGIIPNTRPVSYFADGSGEKITNLAFCLIESKKVKLHDSVELSYFIRDICLKEIIKNEIKACYYDVDKVFEKIVHANNDDVNEFSNYGQSYTIAENLGLGSIAYDLDENMVKSMISDEFNKLVSYYDFRDNNLKNIIKIIRILYKNGLTNISEFLGKIVENPKEIHSLLGLFEKEIADEEAFIMPNLLVREINDKLQYKTTKKDFYRSIDQFVAMILIQELYDLIEFNIESFNQLEDIDKYTIINSNIENIFANFKITNDPEVIKLVNAIKKCKCLENEEQRIDIILNTLYDLGCTNIGRSKKRN